MRKAKFFISMILIVSLLCSFIPSFAETASETEEEFPVITEEVQVPFMLYSYDEAVKAPASYTPGIFDYYCRTVLAECPDAQRFYSAIIDACSQLQIGQYRQSYTLPQILIRNISDKELFNRYRAKVFDCVFNDRPDFFWFFKVSYSYGYAGTTFVCNITADCSGVFMSDDHIGLGRKMMDDGIAEVLAGRPKGGDTLETLAYFNDWLCENNVYCTSSAETGEYMYANTIVSALSSKNSEIFGPVCQGYASAFKHLCNLVGIDCVMVLGMADGGLGAGSHAWNAVHIGNDWYAVDTTWNDSLDIWDSHFMVGNNTVVMPWLESQNAGKFATSHFPGFGEYDGLDNKYPVIAQNAYQPVIEAKGGATCDADKIYLPLGTYTPDSVFGVIANSSLMEYKKSGRILSEDTFISNGTVATFKYQSKIYDNKTVIVRGDVNGDGRITSGDYMMLKRYFDGAAYTGDTLDALDVNADGKIRTTDYFTLMAYFTGEA